MRETSSRITWWLSTMTQEAQRPMTRGLTMDSIRDNVRSLLLVSIFFGCIAIFMLPSTSAATTEAMPIYYDEELLCVYIHLCQKLRKEIGDLRDSLLTRAIALQSTVNGKKGELRESISGGNLVSADFYRRSDVVASAMEITKGYAVHVWAMAVYTDILQCPFTDTKVLQGVTFVVSKGRFTAPLSGVYLLEYTMRVVDGYYFASNVLVSSTLGDVLHDIRHEWVYAASTPTLEMFELEAGDTIDMSGLLPFYSWAAHYLYDYFMVPGVATQMTILYMGPSTNDK